MTPQIEQRAEGEPRPDRRGAVVRLFGVILMFLGLLDSMLAWRGGFEANAFYGILIGSGLLLYAVGSIARQRRGD